MLPSVNKRSVDPTRTLRGPFAADTDNLSITSVPATGRESKSAIPRSRTEHKGKKSQVDIVSIPDNGAPPAPPVKQQLRVQTQSLSHRTPKRDSGEDYFSRSPTAPGEVNTVATVSTTTYLTVGGVGSKVGDNSHTVVSGPPLAPLAGFRLSSFSRPALESHNTTGKLDDLSSAFLINGQTTATRNKSAAATGKPDPQQSTLQRRHTHNGKPLPTATSPGTPSAENDRNDKSSKSIKRKQSAKQQSATPPQSTSNILVSNQQGQSQPQQHAENSQHNSDATNAATTGASQSPSTSLNRSPSTTRRHHTTNDADHPLSEMSMEILAEAIDDGPLLCIWRRGPPKHAHNRPRPHTASTRLGVQGSLDGNSTDLGQASSLTMSPRVISTRTSVINVHAESSDPSAKSPNPLQQDPSRRRRGSVVDHGHAGHLGVPSVPPTPVIPTSASIKSLHREQTATQPSQQQQQNSHNLIQENVQTDSPVRPRSSRHRFRSNSTESHAGTTQNPNVQERRILTNSKEGTTNFTTEDRAPHSLQTATDATVNKANAEQSNAGQSLSNTKDSGDNGINNSDSGAKIPERSRTLRKTEDTSNNINGQSLSVPFSSRRGSVTKDHIQIHPHPPSHPPPVHAHPHPHSAVIVSSEQTDPTEHRLQSSTGTSLKSDYQSRQDIRSAQFQSSNVDVPGEPNDATESSRKRGRGPGQNLQVPHSKNPYEADPISPLPHSQANPFAQPQQQPQASGPTRPASDANSAQATRRRSISYAPADRIADGRAPQFLAGSNAQPSSLTSSTVSNAAATAAALAGRVRRVSIIASHITGQTLMPTPSGKEDEHPQRELRRNSLVPTASRPTSAMSRPVIENKNPDALYSSKHTISGSSNHMASTYTMLKSPSNTGPSFFKASPNAINSFNQKTDESMNDPSKLSAQTQKNASKGMLAKSDEDLDSDTLDKSKQQHNRPRSMSTNQPNKSNQYRSESSMNSFTNDLAAGSRHGSRVLSRRGSAIGYRNGSQDALQLSARSQSASGSEVNIMRKAQSGTLSQEVADILSKPVGAGKIIPRSITMKIEQRQMAAATAAANKAASLSELNDNAKGNLGQFAEENDEQVKEFQEQKDPEAVKHVGIRGRNPRGKWALIYHALLFGRLLSHMYRGAFKLIMNANYASQGTQNDSFLYMLKNHQAKADPVLTSKVIELLNSSRSGQDLETMERLLTIRLKAMQRFTIDQRLKFCKIMQYESFPSGSLIVKEGHVSKAFYFLLNGQVEIFKLKDGLKYRLNALNAGESFGDRTMNMLNDKRTACVATTGDSGLLKIDKTDFFEIANIRDEKHMANRFAEIARIPIFATSEGGFVEKMTSFCQFVTFEPNEPIIFEGSSNIKVYWVLKGTCKCFKVVPFLRKHLGTTYESGEKTSLVPYDPATTGTVSATEEIISQLLAIQELEFGRYFPEFPPLPSDMNSNMFQRFDRSLYVKFLETEDPTKTYSKAAASVVASTKVEVVCINRAEFAKIAPESVLIELIEQDHVFNVTLAQLQEAYLRKLNWDNYRKKISVEVTGRRIVKK